MGFSLSYGERGLLSSYLSRAAHVGASRIVEHGLNSCGADAFLLHGMRNLPRPGIKPVTPALAGIVWQLLMTNFPPFSLNLLG